MTQLRIFMTMTATVVAASFSAVPAATAEKERQTSAAAVSLFNGDDLGRWKSIDFGGQGDVHVAFDGSLTLELGVPLTGVVWTGDIRELPRSNYEISLEAKKHSGEDFFCGLTFPVGKSHATFVCGGWGGSVTGISSIDGRDAADNETTRSIKFENGAGTGSACG